MVFVVQWSNSQPNGLSKLVKDNPTIFIISENNIVEKRQVIQNLQK